MPLKEVPEKALGDLYYLAKKRFLNLERKFAKQPDIKVKYTEFIKEYRDLGHLSEIKRPKFGYYLPHHAVLRENSETTKLRVVFDASAKTTTGKSLNDIQLIGPVVQDDLLSILLRFRCNKYVLTGDIQKMYRQVEIEPCQRHLQLILWRDEVTPPQSQSFPVRNTNLSQPIKVLQLNTVTYGTASAPYLSTRCLLQLARECSDPVVSNTVEHDIYMDDINTGAQSRSELIRIYEGVQKVLHSGGFPLHKVRSNFPEIIKDKISSETLELNKQFSILGLNWSPGPDTLHFSVNIACNEKVTKRSIISMTCKIFDPLGLLCASIIKAKIILQSLWCEKLKWDDPVPPLIVKKWNAIANNLNSLSKIIISRNVLSGAQGESELHCFVDASHEAYGACVYLRFMDVKGNISVNLLCAKSRVAPLKALTTPRLELCGALLGARLSTKVLNSIRYPVGQKVMWCDSTIVLGWINTQPKTLKTFVANRVSEIQELTQGFLWRHVPSNLNPADLASRGVDPERLLFEPLWWEGPSFLKEGSSKWPEHPYTSIELPELKAFVQIEDVGHNKQAISIDISRHRIERTASIRWRGSVRRIVAAFIYNLSCLTHGCSTGWVSGVLGNEALAGGAWLAALPCLVALPAAPFFAFLADAKGRKAGAFCICVSFIISWFLAAWCGPRGVWAARVAAGAGGAGALALAPLYSAEIAPRTRGLAALPALACSCGILFAYGAGGILSAHALSLSMAAPPTILLISLLWLPETPPFLISVGRVQDAAKVICWFDGSDFREDLTDVIEQQEVRIRTSDCYGKREAMRRQDSETYQPMLKRSSGLDSNSDKRAEQSTCRELFRERRSRRALLSCCVLVCTAAGSGAGAVSSFAAAVLRHSAHAVPLLNLTVYNYTFYNGTAPRTLFEASEAGSMLCGTALVLGAAVATVTVDKLGRKMLLLWSCFGMACCLAVLGAYCDPRLRVFSWYTRHLWPYRKTHENNINEKLLEIPHNTTFFLNENVTNGLMIKTFFNETKPWNRIKDVNGSHDDVVWTEKPSNETYKEYEDNNGLILTPAILLSIVLFLYNIGLGSVPYVLTSELFPVQVRGLASSFLISWMWTSSFLQLRYYGCVAYSVGFHGTYYISACITLLGALYTYLAIPETKGKSQQQIDEDLDGPFIVMRKRKNRR